MTVLFDNTALIHKVNQRFNYGWVIVFVSALGIFASGPGQSHIFSVYFPKIAQDLDLSFFAITFAYTAATLVVSFALPLVGKQVDRRGPRRMVLLVGFMFALTILLFSMVNGLVLLCVTFAMLRFLGQGSLMLCCNNMVSQWFNRRRGIALSFLSWGFAVSMALHPTFADIMSDAVGWRMSWVYLSIITFVLVIVPMAIFGRDKPEDVGLAPDGDGATEDNDAVDTAQLGLSLTQARQTPVFWVITFSLMSLAGLVTSLFLFQVKIFEVQGVSSLAGVSMGTLMFFVTAITMVMCVPLFGRMLDTFNPERIFAIALLIMSAALISITWVTNVTTALIYAVVFGLANAAIHAHYVFLWAHYFGRKHLGSIQGYGQSLAVVGASILPLPFGWVFDKFGSFSPALYVSALIPVVCAFFVLRIQRPELSPE